MELENPLISLILPSNSKMKLTLIWMPRTLISNLAQMVKTDEVEHLCKDKKLALKLVRLILHLETRFEIM